MEVVFSIIGATIIVGIIIVSASKKKEEKNMTPDERYWNEWKKIK